MSSGGRHIGPSRPDFLPDSASPDFNGSPNLGRRHLMLRVSPISALSVLLALAACGCNKPDEIVRYTVAKPPPREAKPQESSAAEATGMPKTAKKQAATPDVPAGPARLLGAIIPHGNKTWFFKLTGPSEAVDSQTQSFAAFLGSIRFPEDEPKWTLPEGWVEEPGSQMRFATIRIAADEGPLEMSVTPLAKGDGSFEASLLANVNRWRGQFGLEPIAEGDLAQHAHKVELRETMWIVKFEGRMSPSQGMGAAPVAGNAPSAKNSERAGSPSDRKLQGSGPAAAAPFDCQIPEGWTAGPAGQFQQAVYEVRDGDRQVMISISAAGGDLAANVNRWRQQVQLPALDAGDLEKELRQIKVDGHDGTYVEAIGPESAKTRETILGVIVEADGRQWFLKLRGDAELAAREKPNFEKFVQSIRFRKP